MQQNNLAFVIASARDDRHSDALAAAVAASIEVGVVVPSILRANLEAAGLELADDQVAVADYGFASLGTLKRVLILEDGDIIAMGAAVDADEALLASVLGWFREHPLEDIATPAGIAVATSGA